MNATHFTLATWLGLGLLCSGCRPPVAPVSSSSATQATEALPTDAHAGPPTAAPTPPESTRQTFQVKGVVREIKPDRRSVVIRHEEVPDYMPAMTMPFDVKDTNELSAVQAGDAVAFRLIVTDDEGWIDQVRKLEADAAPPAPPARPKIEGVRIVREVEELKEGDALPEYRFVNELGQPLALLQFQGQALALNFIYTRCPYPNFCPRMSANFAAVQRTLLEDAAAPTNWHLLSLSFDPAWDTPARLRAYAERHAYVPARWSFLTGEMIDIDAITEQFGLIVARDGEGFSHNARTAVVDATGKIQRILIGNEWKPEELVAELRRAAQAR